MKAHEYQAKAILAQFGVPVPKGRAASTPEEARENTLAGQVAVPEAFWKDLEPLVQHWESGVDR